MEEAKRLFQGRRVIIVYPGLRDFKHEFEIVVHCKSVLAFHPAGYNPETNTYREDDLIRILTDPGGTRVVSARYLNIAR